MYATLDRARLRTGELLEVGLVLGPEEERAPAVRDLLGHKGGEWQHHIASALAGGADSLETRFYVGALGEELVANVMTVESLGVGILGHVFTRPEHRRKGICQTLLGAALADFRARGGRSLLLGTGFESPPYWIYHGFGFRSVRGGFMRYTVGHPGEFAARWFAPRPASVVEARWEHWPMVAQVASFPGAAFLRSAAWGVFGVANLEGPYVSFLSKRETDERHRAVMLAAEDGAVAGCATLVPAGSWPDRMTWPGVGLLDAFSHPAFADRLPDLVRAVLPGEAKVIAYTDARRTPRSDALEAAGMVREGCLTGFLRAGDTVHDVWLYGTPSG
ncbi:MAG: GNAT family N-acetyltransferase [Chthonomonadales bacterium]|nr:GNAT family N-acetyltransferase [Chthonomonadales bacterium]